MHIVCILGELLALFLSRHLDYLYSVTAGNSAGSVDSLWTLATTQEGGEGRRRREKEGRWEEGIGEGEEKVQERDGEELPVCGPWPILRWR